MSNCVPFLYSLLVAILLLNPSLNLKSQSPKKQHPFNDKTEDGVKFRLQDQRRNLQEQNTAYMIIAENYKIIAEN